MAWRALTAGRTELNWQTMLLIRGEKALVSVKSDEWMR